MNRAKKAPPPLWKVRVECNQQCMPEPRVRVMRIENLDELSEWFNESGPEPESVDLIIVTLNRK
jgi:hypothetical protein